MLEERDIIRHCESRVLRRARNIVGASSSIFDRKCQYVSGRNSLTKLRCRVQSSQDWRQSYDCTLMLDEDAGKVVEYDCTCNASLSSSGMCKHSAAAALMFLEAPASFAGYDAVHAVQSSAGVKKAMEELGALGAAADESADGEFESIELEPCFVYAQGAWAVRFSVASIEGKYVIKDIDAFVTHCKRGDYFSYGERLAFTHRREAFTPYARKLVAFLERAIDIRKSLAADALNSFKFTQNQANHALPLAMPEIVELLGLVSGQVFSVDDNSKLNHKPVRSRVIEGNPPLHIRIDEMGEDGYTLDCDIEASVITYADELYIWAESAFYKCDANYAACLPFLRFVYCNRAETPFLSNEDASAFCVGVLPIVEPFIEIDMPDQLALLKPRDCEIEIYLDRDARICTCEAYAIYDTERVPLFEALDEPSELEYGLRDEARETRARTVLSAYFPVVAGKTTSDAAHPLHVADDADIARILANGIAEFREIGTLFTTPGFESFISARHPKVSFGLSIHANLVNMTASVHDLPRKELAALLDSYHKRRRYHRLSDGSFVDIAASDLAQVDEYASELGMSAQRLVSGNVELPLYRAFQLDGIIEGAQRDRAFYDYVSSIDEAVESEASVPEGFEGELRGYQLEGLKGLTTISDLGLGGILADEMGLGKTIQLIVYILSQVERSRAYGPNLIVCPASVVYNWAAEFKRFAPGVRVAAVAGTKEARDELLKECELSEPGDRDVPDVLITSYDLLRRDAESYEKLNLYSISLDEAQYIKNHATVSARSVKSLDALHRFALTGTPIENRLSELWSIFDFLMPGLLGRYEHFRTRYEQPILDGDERAQERLQALVGHFILRRMKEDVLTDLPDKDETVVMAYMGDEQMQLYRALEQRLRESISSRTRQAFGADRIAVLAEITRLRELCCDPSLLFEDYVGGAAKLDTIVDLIESSNDASAKVLVFSQFVRFLEIVAQRLDEQGIAYYTITGSTPKKKRIELVNAFNSDETPVFLVSLKAGGTGLNLTGASVVIHADPWWNLAAENQATDRAHRIGQQRKVSVYKVIAKDTIEERIVTLQQAKSRLADKFVRSDGAPLSSLGRDELLQLLEG